MKYIIKSYQLVLCFKSFTKTYLSFNIIGTDLTYKTIGIEFLLISYNIEINPCNYFKIYVKKI